MNTLQSRTPLKGKKIAILATDGFEQSELFSPRDALLNAGAEIEIVSIKEGQITGWNEDKWGEKVSVDKLVTNTNSADYDALMLPGGLFNPDSLRQDKHAKAFIDGFFGAEKNKPVAAICHAPWLLAEINKLRDRTITSFPSIKSDLMNAGANWVNEEVCVDRGLVTSRSPEDLDAFNAKFIEEVLEGKHKAH
ncbi:MULTISPECIES: type 1 glutamine amidotransferase domain-containing protein [Pseudoalteromonas]|jgi:protease I|uniref:type 1 glutamine amidotransferase domain-containing protein n=1 Tax=Pseudoalteromonas TaxID=53246 RepID=UPI0000EABB41|nr:MULTISPECIES: type 1 glutamine amidotransferase domain-containing protein [Pseudoalteromonas]EAW28463.1 proteinase [Alteromonadales bacterium TW-7]ATG57991.1 type 1 glutamine amidotransferase [Pseudoalteromonas marina]KAF7780722.1 protease I [Pseudoalteromonas marina]MDP2485383.1 type 1 glutamine amidotransferase domain-containing protein [Pseudoalteromonas marina]TMS82550.1 type 1 glutamine amidotransferase [Pseudoalteromonas sp. S554]|tara:strand:- start:188 stop:766 length:579 start_codon:yes stop_codon:yes gene_type:complete